MKYNTKPIFIVGSGRCGTRALYKILNKEDNITAHHEYLCELVQKEACKKMMGLKSKQDTLNFLKEYYYPAIIHEKRPYWIDCSNKLSWFINDLKEIFPDCKFILLLRDGRKVSSSFYNKLNPEIYHDSAVNSLEKWMNDKKNVEPPTEKPFWWILPEYYSNDKDANVYNQFQKICWHWKTVNNFVLESFKKINKNDFHIVKLEELISKRHKQIELFDFMGIEFKNVYSKALARPENVFVPYDFKLNEEQKKQFADICMPLMRKLDYKGHEYDVQY